MRHQIYNILIAAFAVGASLQACSSTPPVTSSTSDRSPSGRSGMDRPDRPGLTQEYAAFRSSLISNVNYELSFDLDEKSPDYSGKVLVRFDIIGSPLKLTLDFAGGKIDQLNINGVQVEKPDYNGRFILLKSDHLKSGPNVIQAEFKHPFSTQASGLYRFTDPEDEKTYVYSDFEPYNANQAFPCFDQPDLKASFQLKVKVPKDWTVISSNHETSSKAVTDLPEGPKLWTFPATKRFSTYLFSLHAGQFHVWTSAAGKVPLRLFARQSLAKYVIPAEWFKTTREGLKFYGAYFDYPYPFEKYDQIIVPEYGMGAMENVAAVTFSERFIQRGPQTRLDREHRASIILHEMAHMWFGDLVTLKWWNDLWLNETFATYMGHKSLAQATEFKEAWQSFFSNTKQSAYFEDQLITTHPISGEVKDTAQAFASFDGISYGKGASVMKQLAFYLGEDSFRSGVRQYLKTFEYRNAERKDFIQALEQTRTKSLSVWSSDWLETAGLNSLEEQHVCAEKKLVTLNLIQTSPFDHPTLRAHRIQIGLYYKDKKGALVKRHELTANYSGTKTTLEGLGTPPCPDFVHLNEADNDYVRVKLDASALETVKSSLSKFENPFARRMIWRALWDQARDAQLSLQDYLDLLIRHLPKETDENTASTILATLSSVLDFTPPNAQGELRAQLLEKIETFLWKQFRTARGGSDLQKLYWDTLSAIGSQPETLAHFAEILETGNAAPGLKLDSDRRWKLIRQINSHDPPIGEPIRLTELEKDKSNRGLLLSIEAEAAQPIYEVKELWFREITAEKPRIRFAEARAAMKFFYGRDQDRFKRHFGEKFFQKLLKLAETASPEFLTSYTSALIPTLCDEASVKYLDTFLSKHSSLPFVAAVELKKKKQELERCIRVRSVAVQKASQIQNQIQKQTHKQ